MRKASGVMSFFVGLALLVFTATSPAAANGGGNDKDPRGFNGTVKIHEGATESEPTDRDNEPKVCTFHIHGFNFDRQATGWWKIERHNRGGTAAAGNWGPASNDGEWRTGVMTLPPDHYKLYWDQ